MADILTAISRCRGSVLDVDQTHLCIANGLPDRPAAGLSPRGQI